MMLVSAIVLSRASSRSTGNLPSGHSASQDCAAAASSSARGSKAVPFS